MRAREMEQKKESTAKGETWEVRLPLRPSRSLTSRQHGSNGIMEPIQFNQFHVSGTLGDETRKNASGFYS